MYNREVYEITPDNAVSTMESLAEQLVSLNIRTLYTLKGYTTGLSKDPNKLLLPLRQEGSDTIELGINPASYNYNLFFELLNGAKLIAEGEELELQKRFKIDEFLRQNLSQDEELDKIMTQYGIYRRDDYRWHLSLYYRDWHVRHYFRGSNENLLILEVADNGDESIPTDEKFKELYQKLFGSIMDRYSTRRLQVSSN